MRVAAVRSGHPLRVFFDSTLTQTNEFFEEFVWVSQSLPLSVEAGRLARYGTATHSSPSGKLLGSACIGDPDPHDAFVANLGRLCVSRIIYYQILNENFDVIGFKFPMLGFTLGFILKPKQRWT